MSIEDVQDTTKPVRQRVQKSMKTIRYYPGIFEDKLVNWLTKTGRVEFERLITFDSPYSSVSFTTERINKYDIELLSNLFDLEFRNCYVSNIEEPRIRVMLYYKPKRDKHSIPEGGNY